LKILVLIHELPPIGGGGGRVAQDVARVLVERGHKVQIIAPYLKGLPFRSQLEGIHIIRMPSLRKQPYSADLLAMTGYLLSGFLIGLWKIWRFKPDLIHVHFAVPAGALAWFLHKLTGVPYVLTTHLGDIPGGVPEKTDNWFRWIYPLTPQIWRDAARITAVSEFTRQLASKHYPVDIRVIPNGIDTHGLNPTKSVTVHSVPRILFAGRFVPQKNLVTLVKALDQIRDLNWDCVLIGDGFLMEEIRRMVTACDLDGRVRFTGWLAPEDVIAETKAADIFFMPSLSEGISISALQSLALGLAVVVSNVGGLGELVEQGRNGFLHQPSDLNGFAESLRTLLSDAEFLNRARMESLTVAERFDIKTVGQSYEEIFSEVLNATTGSILLQTNSHDRESQ
jgi:glycosyltransferase involved in cell wall biosynthesis